MKTGHGGGDFALEMVDGLTSFPSAFPIHDFLTFTQKRHNFQAKHKTKGGSANLPHMEATNRKAERGEGRRELCFRTR